MAKNNSGVEQIPPGAVPALDMRSSGIFGHGLGRVMRLSDEIHIEDVRVAQYPLPALPLAKEFPRAADFQIVLGDREAIIALKNDLQPPACRIGQITVQ